MTKQADGLNQIKPYQIGSVLLSGFVVGCAQIRDRVHRHRATAMAEAGS
jgi:hypothetical protein